MRVSNRCYAVTGLGYSAPWFVNAGFIIGDHTTLIVDTGGNRQAAQTIHGYAQAAKPTNKIQVINTEKHFDHIGGNSYFLEQGIAIYGHHQIARTPEEFQAEIQEFNNSIPCKVRRTHGEANAFFSGTKLANPDHPLQQETKFDLGECLAHVIFTPGHTPTNLSVWLPEDKVLFTGDCLINEYLPNLDAGSPEDWKIWLTSIDKVEAVGAQVLVAGHGPVARGEKVQQVLATVRQTLHDAIAHGHSPTASGLS